MTCKYAMMISLNSDLEMDKETFDVMWEMSAPGHPAEDCFLRVRQEEFYCEEDVTLSGPFDGMPEVRLLCFESSS